LRVTVDEMAHEGMRVLGVARASVPANIARPEGAGVHEIHAARYGSAAITRSEVASAALIQVNFGQRNSRPGDGATWQRTGGSRSYLGPVDLVALPLFVRLISRNASP
jgi:hypothetical protein